MLKGIAMSITKTQRNPKKIKCVYVEIQAHVIT